MRVLLALACAVASAAAQDWKLGPSDWARYEIREVTRRGGKDRFGKGKIASVFGHDIRSGQFRPVSPRRRDLPVILGLHVARGAAAKFKLALHDVTALSVRGRLENKPGGIGARWTFRSRGKPKKTDVFRLLKGEAHVAAVFDAERGLMKSARIGIGYELKKHDPKPKDKPKVVRKVYDIRLVGVRAHRYKGFRKEVDAAIAAGVAHLRTLQEKDGNFKPHGDYKYGTTALCVLTLASCGVPATDPAMQKALAYMDGEDPKRTYELAMGLVAFERVYTPPGEGDRARRKLGKRDLPPHRRAWCEKAARYLESIAVTPGSWEYRVHNGRFIPNMDTSNTQYGVLGLRAAARMGIPVRDHTWVGVVRHFKQVRERKPKRGSVALLYRGQALGETRAVDVAEVAGFMYRRNSPNAWGSMTCAGIASLAIARHQLDRAKSSKLDGGMRRDIANMILGAWAWLDRNWAMDRNPHKRHGADWYYYYLYSLERAGVLTGVKRVGGRDWYFEGAVQLLARQDKGKGKERKGKGSWNEGGGADVSETCFALLFLKRATSPLSGGR